MTDELAARRAEKEPGDFDWLDDGWTDDAAVALRVLRKVVAGDGCIAPTIGVIDVRVDLDEGERDLMRRLLAESGIGPASIHATTEEER